MRRAALIRLDEQIAAPDVIALHGSGNSVLHLSPGLENQILMFLERRRRIAFADRHLPPGFPPPIEVMRNRPTAGVR